MRRTFGVLASVMLVSAPAWADVTLTSKMTGKMAGGDGTTQVVKIKGSKMRSDTTRGNGGDMTSTIFDVEAGKMIVLDHKKKEAMVLDTTAIVETMGKGGGSIDVKTDLKPTSEKKQVAGYDCTVYDTNVAVTMSPGEGMNIQMVMTGPACLSANAPGKAEYEQFYAAAVAKGFFFTDPRAAKAQPGMAKAIAEASKKWAEAGVPLSSTTTVKFDGGGFMTGMMNKMMGGPTTTELTKVETAAIADSEFATPADYKVKKP
jgi:Domain of unknown function (DUF4412)